MRYFLSIISIIICIFSTNIFANKRFTPNVSCTDSNKYCTSSGERIIEGIKVTRACWEWAYTKQCNYPSKNDCARFEHCYALGQYDCVLRDPLGNCVNILMEFSCKRKVQTKHESKTVRQGLEEKEGIEGLICKGVPCMDGNCFDKSYQMDEDMVQSVSYLGAMAQGKNVDGSFKIFEGQDSKCSKKPVGYMNCCAVGTGWGSTLGAKCNKDENILRKKREKNLCVYVGKSSKKILGITVLIRHHFCCFNNMLEKTIQIQGRKQLGLNFGSGRNPDCRGFTFEEIQRIDWSKIDFSEFADEIKKKLVMPDISDAQGRIKSHFQNNTREFNHSKPAHENNKRAGINKTINEGE